MKKLPLKDQIISHSKMACALGWIIYSGFKTMESFEQFSLLYWLFAIPAALLIAFIHDILIKSNIMIGYWKNKSKFYEDVLKSSTNKKDGNK